MQPDNFILKISSAVIIDIDKAQIPGEFCAFLRSEKQKHPGTGHWV